MLSAQDKYHHMDMILNEKQWRQYLAIEAKEKDNVALIAREAGASVNTIKRGIMENLLDTPLGFVLVAKFDNMFAGFRI